MNQPNFVFINSKELATEFILSSSVETLTVFRALKFESIRDMENFIKKYNILGECVVIDGYNILICIVGNLYDFNDLPRIGDLGNKVLIETISTELKSFYEKERIHGNETRLKKFARQ